MGSVSAEATTAATTDRRTRLMVEFRNVSRRFGRLTVLKNINLAVAAGEAVVIIGPSGSGKSTLLRCVNYLERPDEGDVWVDGERVGPAPGEKLSCAVLERRLD